MSNEVRIHTSVKDDVSGPLDKIKDKFDTLGKSKGAQSILQGVGVGIGAKAFGLLESAVSGVGEAFSSTIEKAREDEVVTARLNASLAANAKGWDGNREALDGYIASQTNLGFTDDETSASLAKLIAATGDVTAAQNDQAVAMDLARLKGISLADATDALTKVEGGSYRILKSLGIELPKNATQVQALAAVEKVAAGQAQAYAKTTAGSFDSMNAKIDAAQEKIGKGLLPVLAGASDLVGGLFDQIDGEAQKALGSLSQQQASLLDTKPTLNELQAEYQKLQEAKDASMSTITTQAQEDELNHLIAANLAAQKSTQSLGKAQDDLNWLGRATEVQAVADDIENIGRSARQSYPQVKSFASSLVSVGSAAQAAVPNLDELYGALYGKDQAKADRAQALLDIGDLKKQIDDIQKKPKISVADKLQLTVLNGKLDDAKAKATDALIELAKLGNKPAKKDLQKWLDDTAYLVAGLDAAAERARLDLMKLAGVPGFGSNTSQKDPTAPHKAGGGPVARNKPYIVGENGPEWFVPDSGGAILPHGTSPGGASMPSGSAALSVAVTVNAGNGVITPGAALDIGNAVGPIILKWMQRNQTVPFMGTPQRG